MTVRELINTLNKIQDKDMVVCCYNIRNFTELSKVNIGCRLSRKNKEKICEKVVTLH